MKPLIITVAIATAFICLFNMLPTGNHAAENDSFILTKITVFDGEQWHDNSSIAVIDGFVRAHTTAEYEQFTVIDGEGSFLIPGLIDAHTHSWGSALQRAPIFGVTTHLDMFTDEAYMRANHHSRPSAYLQAGLYSSGHLITSKGGHGTQFPIKVSTLDTAKMANSMVQERIARGADYIKIVYDALAHKGFFNFRFTSINYEMLKAAIDAAKQQGVLAIVHIHNELSAQHAIKAGADGLAHSFADRPISENTLNALRDSQVFVVATLSVKASFSNQKRGERLIEQSPLSSVLTDNEKQQLRTQMSVGKANDSYWQTAKNNVAKMIDAGVTVLAGSDLGNPGTVSGLSLHDEMLLLQDAGMTATQVLKSATSETAKRFKLKQRGFLKDGYRADMVLLSEDPRTGIRATQSIKSVWLNGRLVQK